MAAAGTARTGGMDGGRDGEGALRTYRVTVNALPCEVLLLPASAAATADRHLVFFPGDVQMRRAEMDADLRGGSAEWRDFSLDDALPALARGALGADGRAHVWCLRPARMVYHFAAYQQFAAVTLLGAVQQYRSTADRAGGGVAAALAQAMAAAAAEGLLDAGAATEMPLALVGFSKGVVVLNQLAAELAADAPAARALAARASEWHWVDGGNGAERGAFPPASEALDALISLRPPPRLAVHSTPYMLRSPTSPWVAAERDAFIDGLRARGAAVSVDEYFEQEPPSLERHFGVLQVLRRAAQGGEAAGAQRS